MRRRTSRTTTLADVSLPFSLALSAIQEFPLLEGGLRDPRAEGRIFGPISHVDLGILLKTSHLRILGG